MVVVVVVGVVMAVADGRNGCRWYWVVFFLVVEYIILL